MKIASCSVSGAGRSLLLAVLCFLPWLPIHAASVILGTGEVSNHLLILFAPGQTLSYELRHDGSIQSGQQLLASVIQATGGVSVTTASNDTNGIPIPFSSQLTAWNRVGLFAHFYDYGWGIFLNGLASGTVSAASDGSWSSYFTYQIGGADADFISAPVGASGRILSNGDHDAYVLTSAFSSPGLAAWMATHEITDLEEDSDGDGLTNLLEYALRRHPHVSDSTGAIEYGLEENSGTHHFTLTYRRPHDDYADIPEGADAGYDGVGYTVETSPDLVRWDSGTNHVTQTVIPDISGPMVSVVARVPADSPKRFLRLRIQIP